MIKKPSCKLSIDHVGILGSSIDVLITIYRKLGFSVIGPTELVSIDSSGARTLLGQQSAHIMFQHGYIELTAVTQPTPDHHLARFLHGPFGLRLLFLNAEDIITSRNDCVSSGLDPTAVQTAAREITYGTGGLARFRWFALPFEKYPEALLGFVQHKTPDIVFQDNIADHANSALGLSRIIHRSDRVPSTYQVLETVDSETSLEAWPSSEIANVFGNEDASQPPLAGIGLYARDLGNIEDILKDNDLNYHSGSDFIAVKAADAGGTGILFEAAV